MSKVGGYTDQKEPWDDTIKGVADFALKKIQRKRLGVGLKVTKIVSVATQVVKGTNYKMVLDLEGVIIGPAKNKPTFTETQEVVVYSIPWEKKMELTSNTITTKSY